MAQQIIKLPEVKIATAMSGSTVYRLIEEGKFPRQIKLSQRSSGWVKAEVDRWIDERIAASRPEETAS